MFQQMWPDLLSEGYIQKLKTPLLKVKVGRKTLAFFSLEEFNSWDSEGKKYEVTYLKGLGGNTTDDFKKYMFDKTYFETIKAVDQDDFASIDLAFDPDKADMRKTWLYGI